MSSFDNFFNAKNPKKRKEKEKMKRKKIKKNCFVVSLCFCCLLAMAPTVWADSSASSSAGASAEVVNAPSTSSSLDATIMNNPNIANDLTVGLSFDNHSVTNIENKGNRQFSQVGILGGPAPTSYFGDWKTGPDEWNVFPINLGETWVKDGETKKIEYSKIWKRIYKKYPATDRITVVGFGQVHGKKVGSMSVMVNAEQCTEDALAIAMSEAMKNGATHLEILASSSLRIPKSSGWHIGTGVGASGVIGEDEKGGVSGASGTGWGVSRLEAETLPFVKVRFWKNGADGAVAIADVPSNNKTTKIISLPEKLEGVK
ncbi:hypothetical protein L6248_02540 [Candidatus Parcubacteria bacterium]|nr:hypothetical protein [Candidatus Parcubacteria bacterium]MCG2700726.1 hypothetical protein [Candidatus Parcubacteria bacterium]